MQKRKIKKVIKKVNLDSFINYYMEGNLRRFLRKHKEQYYYQFTYSRTLKHIKKHHKKAYKIIMLKGLYPNHLRDILNVFITLDNHFDIGFTLKAFKDILDVEHELMELIKEYMQRITQYRFEYNKEAFQRHWMTPKQALREQKARGFIDINDFEEYRDDCAHIVSNINTSLYYPKNIDTGYRLKNDDSIIQHNPYTIATIIGVEGYTRIVMPGD